MYPQDPHPALRDTHLGWSQSEEKEESIFQIIFNNFLTLKEESIFQSCRNLEDMLAFFFVFKVSDQSHHLHQFQVTTEAISPLAVMTILPTLPTHTSDTSNTYLKFSHLKINPNL